MIANNRFSNCTPSFWALVKFISERCGYSKNNRIITYTEDEILELLKKNNILSSKNELQILMEYFNYRADILNTHFQTNLMNAEQARGVFAALEKEYNENHYTCKLPLNKQKGEMRQVAYFTAIINIIAERTLRFFAYRYNYQYGTDIGFDDDPSNLAYFVGEDSQLKGVMSRRLDGAFPSLLNPTLLWEIKEYYYATTFGSRVADGVYEVQLDGYEVSEFEQLTQKPTKHIYFIDAYQTWWIKGKSYLCRIVDMLNMGLVDEVIVGREVLTRWSELLNNELCYIYGCNEKKIADSKESVKVFL